MIMIRDITLLAIFSIIYLQAPVAQSATYYISPTGSDTNPGTSAKPWLTFAYAINSARAWCGDTLTLLNGTYGDGTSTGKITVSGVVCTAGHELMIVAANQRQAKINDNGSGRAVYVLNSAYIIIDGLYARSTDNSGSTSSGYPFFTNRNNHITLKNLVARNPNRYANTHTIAVENSQDVLLEDNEAYVFHRHCVEAWVSERVVVRRQYCNPRGGRIAGGFGEANGLGKADALVTMYPCRDCIQENTIADGTTNPMYLNEMNATYGAGILMSGSKVLGSICYKCDYGNGIYINSRKVADLNHTPQNVTIRDVAFVDWNSNANGLRVTDGVNILLDHITLLSTGGGVNGVIAEDTANGSTPTTNSITMTNMLIAGLTTGTGFRVSNYNTWSGDKLFSNGNRAAFEASPPSNLTNTSTKAHGMGTCKVWVPAGAAIRGIGTGGSDIGANILYRYINGVLTSTPLWNPKTGEFPHGAPDLDETNRVVGQSLFDIHTRLNVNTGGCSFPRNYGNGDSDTTLPAAPAGLRAS